MRESIEEAAKHSRTQLKPRPQTILLSSLPRSRSSSFTSSEYAQYLKDESNKKMERHQRENQGGHGRVDDHRDEPELPVNFQELLEHKQREAFQKGQEDARARNKAPVAQPARQFETVMTQTLAGLIETIQKMNEKLDQPRPADRRDPPAQETRPAPQPNPDPNYTREDHSGRNRIDQEE